MSASVLVIVSLATALLTFRQSPSSPMTTAVPAPTAASAAKLVVAEPSVMPTAAGLAQPADSAPETDGPPSDDLDEAVAPEFARAPELPANAAAPVVTAPVAGPLLPEYRVVAYYGHPHDPAMGIVGEHAMEDLAAILRAEAANYAAADPSRPVVPAFELIATVAQRVPGNDGTYILDTDKDTLTKYIDFAAEQGMVVILDVQVGRSTVANELEKVRDLLARPNVHLAIDPEFAVAEGQIPGEYIGSIDAESITYAQGVLAEITAANGIPPKLLIVHQFREDMITNKDQLAPMPGVQLVIDADGYGAAELKTAVYNFLVRDEPVEFAGVKLFYRQDFPIMTPREILDLVPAPDVVIYQ